MMLRVPAEINAKARRVRERVKERLRFVGKRVNLRA